MLRKLGVEHLSFTSLFPVDWHLHVCIFACFVFFAYLHVLYFLHFLHFLHFVYIFGKVVDVTAMCPKFGMDTGRTLSSENTENLKIVKKWFNLSLGPKCLISMRLFFLRVFHTCFCVVEYKMTHWAF